MSLFAEDRVLVGVVGRRADVRLLLDRRVYRVPVASMPEGVEAEVMGFFTSGAVRYYAVLRGVELVRRRDVLPHEAHHPRAAAHYWLCQMGPVREVLPPIMNPQRRRFAFIHTTWDRFADARTVADLYSPAAWYVRRVYAPPPAAPTPYRSTQIWLE